MKYNCSVFHKNKSFNKIIKLFETLLIMLSTVMIETSFLLKQGICSVTVICCFFFIQYKKHNAMGCEISQNFLFMMVGFQKKHSRYEGFKGTSDMPLYKWRVTKTVTHVFHLSIITLYNKKYFKILLLPLTKKVSLKKL